MKDGLQEYCVCGSIYLEIHIQSIRDGSTDHRVACQKCDVRTESFKSKEEAVSAWNTRTSLTQEPIPSDKDEDMVCKIWDTVKANKPLTAEMIRNINVTDISGETVVMYPAYNGNPQALKRLLECGADPTYEGPYGTVHQILQDNFNECPHKKMQECLQVLRMHST